MRGCAAGQSGGDGLSTVHGCEGPRWPARRLLLKVGANVTSLDEVADAPAAFAVEVASYLQDAVMDQLNRPWPEVPAPDGCNTVLEPRLGPAGVPEWAGRGVVREFGRVDCPRSNASAG